MFNTKAAWISSWGNNLIIRNDRYRQVVLLFMYLRKVEIQPYHKRIVHSVRRAWFFHRELFIPFEDIAYIDYSGRHDAGG